MKFNKAPLEGAYVVVLEPFRDSRGLFTRMFCQKEFASIGLKKPIVQINHSVTQHKGVVRGMHYQKPPACEIKIIRCIRGTVFDVMVDIRENSPTFLKWHGVELSPDNMRMVLIPEGFAHGFQVLTETAELLYHHTEFYSPEHEDVLRFDDPALAIRWPLPVSMASIKDQKAPFINDVFKGIQL